MITDIDNHKAYILAMIREKSRIVNTLDKIDDGSIREIVEFYRNPPKYNYPDETRYVELMRNQVVAYNEGGKIIAVKNRKDLRHIAGVDEFICFWEV